MLVMTISAAVFALLTLALALALHAQTKSYNDVRFHVQLAWRRTRCKQLQGPYLSNDQSRERDQLEVDMAVLEEKLRRMGEVVD